MVVTRADKNPNAVLKNIYDKYIYFPEEEKKRVNNLVKNVRSGIDYNYVT